MSAFEVSKWIWSKQQDYNLYNDSIIAKKEFEVGDLAQGKIIITADSFYRLFVNGQWIADGPSKYWPKHIKYDEIDITAALFTGKNEIVVVARYFGTGDFRHLPIQAGLIAEVEVLGSDNSKVIFGTDKSWQVAKYSSLYSQTPKLAVQLEPFEFYDARFESDFKYQKAEELFGVEDSPWKDYSKRGSPLLSKDRKSLKRLVSFNLVSKTTEDYYCFSPDNLLYPGFINTNANVSQAYAFATSFNCSRDVEFKICEESVRIQNLLIAVDGKQSHDGVYSLSKGEHFILVMPKELTVHDKDFTFKIQKSDALTFCNPVNGDYANPWCFLELQPYKFIRDDMDWIWVYEEDEELMEIKKRYAEFQKTSLKEVKDVKSFKDSIACYFKEFTAKDIFQKQTYNEFRNSEIVSGADKYVECPENLIYDNYEYTVIKADSGSDIQLCYDLGSQVCGYCNFELLAEEGVGIDFFAVENIDNKLGIQHTRGCRNGFSYITKNGLNKYISLKRFSGRYLFVTFKNVKSDVRIRNISMIGSVYPLDIVASFKCSDKKLNKIWDICVNTLELCMDDTFIDCPVYEQAYWIGDARNETLFALGRLRNNAVVKRCFEIAAQSLEMYPMVLSQAPSSWGVIIPSFSFLWQISVWEYYYHTSDREFLSAIYDKVILNTRNALKFMDENGLFKSNYWNMCDWTALDDTHRVVIYNSMFLYAALNAATKIALVINPEDAIWTENALKELKDSINVFWNKQEGGYPDSIHSDGTLSKSFSQHTSYLGLLFDIVEQENKSQAAQNALCPREGLVKVGSPFASMFLYECMEKIGYSSRVVKNISKDFDEMVEADATTVWESYSTGSIGQNSFPTRSHCHAFSCAPLYFLPKIVLGIKQVSPGCKAFDISPVPSDLTFANGSYATPLGTITVSWKIEGDVFKIDIKNPKDVVMKFVRNDSLNEYKIILNGQVL